MNHEKLLQPNPIKTEIIKSYNVVPGATVTLNEIIFESSIISNIEFVEHTYQDTTKTMVIKLYSGNLLVAAIATNEDYSIDEEEGKRPSYWIYKVDNRRNKE